MSKKREPWRCEVLNPSLYLLQIDVLIVNYGRVFIWVYRTLRADHYCIFLLVFVDLSASLQYRGVGVIVWVIWFFLKDYRRVEKIGARSLLEPLPKELGYTILIVTIKCPLNSQYCQGGISPLYKIGPPKELFIALGVSTPVGLGIFRPNRYGNVQGAD